MVDFSKDNKYIYNNIRYKGQEISSGDETQKNLENLNSFVIGKGEIGCELLK